MGRTRALVAAVLLVVLAASSLVLAPPASAEVQASIDDAELGWGESTTVHGVGWQPGAEISLILYAGGQTLATPIAAEDGSIEAVITIPDGVATSSGYKLAVQGNAADGSYGYLELGLTVTGPTPTMSVARRELGWGDVVTVSGERFKPGGRIKVSLLPGNQVLAETTARDDATFAADITIPTGLRSANGYLIVVQGPGIDQIAHYLQTEVTIIGPRPTIGVSLTRLAWGQATNVHGDLWKPGSTVQINVLPDTLPVGEAVVAADGTFDAGVRIPENLPTSDRYFLVATGTGADGHFAYLPESITIIGDRPFIDVSTNRPGRGGSVRVEAHRLQPGSRAELTLVPGFEKLGVVTVDDDGTFTTTIRIPVDAASADPHALVVTGEGRDGLFAYLSAEMILAGTAQGGSAVPPATTTPRDGAPPTDDPDGLSNAALPNPDGTPTNVGLAILLAVVTALTIAVLLLASRRDLREALARRWGAFVHRIPRPGRRRPGHQPY